MKVYAFDLMPWPDLPRPSFYPDPNSLYDPARGHQLYEEHLKQIELYEEYGFDAICINEHHAKPYGLMPSPNLMAAAISQRTRRIRIGIVGNLLPLHAHPVRLAEEIAMLDVLSGGRLISGFTTGVPQEYLALNVPRSEAKARLVEALDLITKAWTEREPFAWHGQYYHYDRVCIWPRPLQQPHPPSIFPAESDEGLEIAASRRFPTGTAYRSTAKSREVFSRYRLIAEKHGWTPTPEDCMVLCPVYVAETNEQARREAEPHLLYFWQWLLSYHKGSMKILGQSPPARPARVTAAEDLPFYEFDFDLCQKEGVSFIGDPDSVTREIQSRMGEMEAGVLMGLFQFGSLPHELAQKNIRLFAEKVLPALKGA